jgi:hypothetical protein
VTDSPTVELVRSVHAAWERRDRSSAEWADAEIEFVIGDGRERGSFRGIDAMAVALRDRQNPWSDTRLETEDFRELDEARACTPTPLRVREAKRN